MKNGAGLENRETSNYANSEQKINDLPRESNFSQRQANQKLQKLEGTWKQGSGLGWAWLFSSLPVQRTVLCLPFLENR